MKKTFFIVIAAIVVIVAGIIIYEKSVNDRNNADLVDAGPSIENYIYIEPPEEFADRYEYFTLETDTVEPSQIEVVKKENDIVSFNISILTYNGSYIYSDDKNGTAVIEDLLPTENTEDYYVVDTINVDGRDVYITAEKISRDDFDTGFWGGLSGIPDVNIESTITYYAFFEDETHIYEINISLNCFENEPMTDELEDDFMTLVKSIRFKS